MRNQIFFVAFIGLVCVSLSCRCPRGAPNPEVRLMRDSSFTPSEVVISSKSYGIPFGAGPYIFLRDGLMYTNNVNALKCPSGYHNPTKDEYLAMITKLGNQALNTFQDANGLALKDNLNLLSATRSFPSETTGDDVFKYEVVSIVANTVVVRTLSLKDATQKFIVRCIENNSDLKVLTFQYKEPVYVGEEVSFSVAETNIQAVQWKVGNQASTRTGLSSKFTFEKAGCNVVQFWGLDLSNTVLYQCQVVYSSPNFLNNKSFTFNVDNIKYLETGTTVNNFNGIFFGPNSFPIAPKDNGGFYIAYQDKTTVKLHVSEYDATYKLLKTFNTQLTGPPNDIVATPWGFVLYVAQGHTSVLYGFSSKFVMKFKRIVMNNGDSPLLEREQISFYDKNANSYYGLRAVYTPDHGKLIYAKGHILLNYAHYDNFKAGSDNVEGHTGDSLLSFNDNGEDVKIGWAWASSHSLIQAMLFDGTLLQVATLGDAYPKNIKGGNTSITNVGSTFDPVNKYAITFSSSLADLSNEVIPGNERGSSCGRLGGIVSNGLLIAVVYAVKPCVVNPAITRNQIGLITYLAGTPGFEDKREIPVLVGEATEIVNLKIGKWGDKILVYIIKSNEKTPSGMNMTAKSYSAEMKAYYMLIDFDGKIIVPMFEMPRKIMPIAEDPRNLKNGDLVWAAMENNQLVIAYLPAK